MVRQAGSPHPAGSAPDGGCKSNAVGTSPLTGEGRSRECCDCNSVGRIHGGTGSALRSLRPFDDGLRDNWCSEESSRSCLGLIGCAAAAARMPQLGRSRALARKEDGMLAGCATPSTASRLSSPQSSNSEVSTSPRADLAGTPDNRATSTLQARSVDSRGMACQREQDEQQLVQQILSWAEEVEKESCENCTDRGLLQCSLEVDSGSAGTELCAALEDSFLAALLSPRPCQRGNESREDARAPTSDSLARQLQALHDSVWALNKAEVAQANAPTGAWSCGQHVMPPPANRQCAWAENGSQSPLRPQSSQSSPASARAAAGSCGMAATQGSVARSGRFHWPRNIVRASEALHDDVRRLAVTREPHGSQRELS